LIREYVGDSLPTLGAVMFTVELKRYGDFDILLTESVWSGEVDPTSFVDELSEAKVSSETSIGIEAPWNRQTEAVEATKKILKKYGYRQTNTFKITVHD